MSYTTGTASNFNQVLSAILTAADDAGWTVNDTNNTINNADAAFKFVVASSSLSVRGGLGIASGDVTGGSTDPLCAPKLYDGSNTVPPALSFSWPAKFHIFTYSDPDTVVVALQQNATTWQFMMFGLAISLGIPGLRGEGALVPFYFASIANRDNFDVRGSNRDIGCPFNNGGGGNQDGLIFGKPESDQNNNPGEQGDRGWIANYFAYVNVPAGFSQNITGGVSSPATLWTGDTGKVAQGNTSTRLLPYINRSPNQWNLASHLVPVTVDLRRPQGFLSAAFQVQHIQFIRNTFFNDEEVKVEGSDQWMIFPMVSKNSADPDPYNRDNIRHSGTFAYAIKYEP